VSGGIIDLIMMRAILPEVLILVLAVLILIFDVTLSEKYRGNLGWITAGGLALILGTCLLFARPGSQPILVWGGMIRFDWLGFTFSMMFLFAASITALVSMDVPEVGKRGEYYLLMLVSTLGMCLMASSADLIMLYLAIETTSIPLYVLAGFVLRDDKSTESGFKYLLFGAMTSTVMLYGFSLLYGFAGTTNIYALTQGFQAGQLPLVTLFASLLLVLVGFGFKISAVPMHFWAPDVYEGAPTPIAGFLSTASKAAGFAVLARVLFAVYPVLIPEWSVFIAVLSVATMTIGNALALAQKNIKRLLAYSSIAQAGYVMIGLVAVESGLVVSSVIFYLVAYIFTNLAAFAVVSAYGRISGSDEISSYAGLSRRNPGLALMLMISFLSLAGMPPFAGFVVKFSVFAAAMQAGMVWLAVVGVLNSIVGLYYYLTVLKVVYLYRSEDEDKPVPITRPYLIAFAVLAVGIILIGTIFAPWFSISNTAAAALF
jgi:NADH-quinone oxidoreductase subunit N